MLLLNHIKLRTIFALILLYISQSFFKKSSYLVMTQNKCRAILWDVDGTLSNSYQLGFTSTQTIMSRNGYPLISESDYHAGTKLTTPRRFAWHVTGNPDDQIGIHLGKQFDELYLQLVNIETAPLYPGIESLVRDLSKIENVVQGALSNACGDYVRSVLKVNEVSEIFCVQLGADDVPGAKPRPDGLLKCCEQLHSTPFSSVYIGDSPSDGQAARACGMYCIGVTWGSHPLESISSEFDSVAHSVTDLKSLLLLWLNKNEHKQQRVSWSEDVVNNEGMNKLRTDNEYWNV